MTVKSKKANSLAPVNITATTKEEKETINKKSRRRRGEEKEGIRRDGLLTSYGNVYQQISAISKTEVVRILIVGPDG